MGRGNRGDSLKRERRRPRNGDRDVGPLLDRACNQNRRGVSAGHQCLQYSLWRAFDEYQDTAAGMASSKFAHREFVTVSVDALKFKRPAYQGDLIETTASVVHTSTHTAGVHVIAKRLDRSEWVTEEICSGFFFMVAIDSQMKPIPIPQFTPNGEDEQKMWDLAQAARDAMKAAGQ